MNRLNEWMDPRHIRTSAFGKRDEAERLRPHMWRYWQSLPARGRSSIIFEGWYSEAIQARVARRIKRPAFWHTLHAIQRFERMLAMEGTLVLKRSGATTVPPIVLTGWQMLIGMLPLLAGAFVFAGSGPFLPSWGSVLLIAYITLVPMTLGNLAWVSVVTLVPANVAGLSSVLVPVVAMIAGALVHGEPLGPTQVAAMLCCGGAMGLVLLRR